MTRLVSGQVDQRNDKGIVINGEWLNVSRFKPVPLPEIGAVVVVGVDERGFIVSVDGSPSTDQVSPAVADETRLRLAVLEAAARFAAPRDVKSSDVLKIADVWLEWVKAD